MLNNRRSNVFGKLFLIVGLGKKTYSAVDVALPEWPINKFKPVQQSKQQSLRAYCPIIYTVVKGLTLDSIQDIMTNCVNLKEVNLSATMLSHDSLDFLVKNITRKIEKLSLRFLFFLGDDHIKTLVNRCTKVNTVSLNIFSVSPQSAIIINIKSTQRV